MRKRLISLLLTFCLVLSVLPVGALSILAEDGILYGDADGNGEINLQDVYLMERYIAGEDDAVNLINFTNADVNADGAVDDIDVQAVKEYLVGNIDSLTPVLYTITFNTDGGGDIEPIKAGAGYTYKGDIPVPAKDAFVFVNWVKEDGSVYFQDENIITGDIALSAVYEDMESFENLQITSFSLKDQPADISFDIIGEFGSAGDVEKNIKLLPKDGSDPVAVSVRENGNNSFTVYAPDGFLAGATYELTLGEGLSFADKDEMYRTAYFIIEKEEIDNLQYNPDMIFIRDTDAMNYTVAGNTTPVLESALLSNDESDAPITGSFTMPGGTLTTGDVVCIYENIHPKDRDYTQDNYADDALAYIRITGVGNGVYQFESLNEDDADQVIAMPDSIPYQVSQLPVSDGTVNKNDYDAYARTMLGKTVAPEFAVNDFITFYTVDFDDMTSETPAAYGQITSVDGDIVSYKLVTKEAVDDFMSMFVYQEVDGEEIKNEIDQAQLLAQIEKQAENSGFALEASEHMIQSAFGTEEIQEKLLNNGFTQTEIEQMRSAPFALAPASGGGSGRVRLEVEDRNISASFINDHFDNGIGVALDIGITLSVTKKISATKTISLKIELSAYFEQEVALGFNVSVEDRWKWYFIIPVLEDLDVTVSIDVQDYTYLSVGAKIYSVEDDVSAQKKWKALSENVTGPNAPAGTREIIRDINKLAVKVKKLRSRGESVKEALEQIEGYKEQLPKVTIDGVEYSVEQLEEALGAEDVSAAFDEVFSAQTEDEAKTGLDQLMDRYKEMLGQECDWVELYNKTLFEKEFHIKIVAIKVGVNFIVKGNVNIALGADIEYQVGKRYSFWIHILDAKSGSSEIDLIDERFGFQFYVMGTLGIRAGIKLDIAFGLISTSIASIGGNVEFGFYLKLWGYFIYYFERLRPANTQKWNETEEMLGALYLEFGIYVTVKFKAQVFANTFKYEPTLYDGEFPLLTAGDPKSVYDFALDPDGDDILYIWDEDANSLNGITMDLPDLYKTMKTMDLCSGNKEEILYPGDKFIVTFSDSRFSIDNGKISVEVPDGARYLSCDMRVVWKCNKLAFSKYDTDITVPVVWTNMSESELNARYTAKVFVGNMTDGYKSSVWSERFSSVEVFDLPTEEEILDLINYSVYETDNGNLKYASVEGYTGESTGLSIDIDTSYFFDVTPRVYTLTVDGIQNADGTTYSRTFTAFYGESFDLSGLMSTGTDNDTTQVYTTFRNFTDDSGEILDSGITVDMQFAAKYGTEAVITANYQDDSRTATYKFVGLGEIDPVVVKFKKGTIPYFENLNDYITEKGGEDASVVDITPAVAPSESSVIYTVICEVDNPKPKYMLNFETNCEDIEIQSQEYQEGSVIFQPTNPKRTGYTFAGWYADSGFTSVFDFSGRMPGRDVTVYAKWTADTYTVSFDPINGSSPISPITIHYDDVYGILPVISHQTLKFLGWFTEKTGGTEIKADTVFKETEDTILYAHWENKKKLPILYSTETKTYDYNGTGHPFEVFALSPYDDGILDDVTVMYMEEVSSGFGTWTDEVPVNSGTYSVQITRPTDNDFLEYKETVDKAIRINKINIAPDDPNKWISKPKIFTTGGVVTVSCPEGIKGDGAITYELQKNENSVNTHVATNSTGFFNNLSEGIYVAIVHVAEGRNYLGTRSYASSGVIVSGSKDGPYSVLFRISTTDGTDSDIYGGVYLKDGQMEVLMDRDNYNDFEAGDTDTYVIGSGIVPWEITGGYIYKAKNLGFRPAWSFTSDIELRYGDKLFSSTLLSGNEVGENQRLINNDITFKRQVTAVGNFQTGGDDSIVLGSSKKYTYSYNGQITDQMMDTYNVMEYYDAPMLTVSSGNAAFDHFIRYTGVTSFEIDVPSLTEYIREFDCSLPTFTVKLTFPANTTSDANSVVKNGVITKTITCFDAMFTSSSLSVNSGNIGTASVSAPRALSVKSGTEDHVTDGTTDIAIMALSPEEIVLNRGKTFEVTLKINDDVSIWGIFADVSFDADIFELIGCTAGNVFAESQFTMQKDLTRPSYRFLATLDTIDTISAKGDIVTLQFRIKEDAEDKDTEISLRMLEGVGKDAPADIEKGAPVQVGVDNAAPVISGIKDGETYYGDTVVTVSESHLDSVTVNGERISVTEGKFTLTPAQSSQTVVVTDKAGNSSTMTVTVLPVPDQGTPGTEDVNVLFLWLAIVFAAVSVLSGTVFYVRKKRTHKK